ASLSGAFRRRTRAARRARQPSGIRHHEGRPLGIRRAPAKSGAPLEFLWAPVPGHALAHPLHYHLELSHGHPTGRLPVVLALANVRRAIGPVLFVDGEVVDKSAVLAEMCCRHADEPDARTRRPHTSICSMTT